MMAPADAKPEFEGEDRTPGNLPKDKLPYKLPYMVRAGDTMT